MGKVKSSRAAEAVLPSTAQALLARRWKRKPVHDPDPRPKVSTISPPPPGYTFLSIGHPDLATKCKELSKEKDADVKVVSATNAAQDTADSLSHHMHRIGYHIRNDVFDEACTWLGYREVKGKLVKAPAFDPTRGFERTLARYGADMIQLGANKATDEEAERVKGAIRELFPKVPDASLNDIFETAWQKGAATIGNVDSIPLARRVQLAVVAHIRHSYTDYDRILQTSSWHEARRAVEPYCLAKLVEWRGEEADDDDDVMEDILQHAIVLSGEESAAEKSEPDRYADNEDSDSDFPHHLGQPSKISATGAVVPQTLSPATPPISNQQGERVRRMLRTRWLDARSSYAQGGLPMPHAAVSTSGNAQYASLPLIQVPTDQKGRPPKRFTQGGMQYTRCAREQLLPYGIIPPEQAFSNISYQSHAFFAPQVQQPVQHPPAARNHPRLFDEHGREVFLDPVVHRLTPASAASTPSPQSAAQSYGRVMTVSPDSASLRTQRQSMQQPRRGQQSRLNQSFTATGSASDASANDNDDDSDEYDPLHPIIGAPGTTNRLAAHSAQAHMAPASFAPTPSNAIYQPGVPFGVAPAQQMPGSQPYFPSATPMLPHGFSPFQLPMQAMPVPLQTSSTPFLGGSMTTPQFPFLQISPPGQAHPFYVPPPPAQRR